MVRGLSREMWFWLAISTGFAIIGGMKTAKSSLFDNPKYPARAGLSARTTALSLFVRH
jgi:hypothetical protein